MDMNSRHKQILEGYDLSIKFWQDAQENVKDISDESIVVRRWWKTKEKIAKTIERLQTQRQQYLDSIDKSLWGELVGTHQTASQNTSCAAS